MPLVYQAFNWSAGVYIGATMGSEMTAAAAGAIGKVRRDPMAMLPFCGYHMGDYFRHWIKMQRSSAKRPRIFHVNWFRKDADGKFLWPGYQREHARSEVDRRPRARPRLGKETPIGWMPRYEDIDWKGCDFPKEKFDQLQAVDREAWKREVIGHEELFIELHDHLPPEMVYERELLICRLSAATDQRRGGRPRRRPAERSSGREFSLQEKPCRAALDWTDEDICPYVVVVKIADGLGVGVIHDRFEMLQRFVHCQRILPAYALAGF